MRYAVLGTGVVGRTIAGTLDSLGHEAVIGTRDPQAALARTEPDAYGNPPYSQWQAEHPQVRLATFADAATHGEAVVNTTAGVSSLKALQSAGAANLAGELVIDIANPLDFSPEAGDEAGSVGHLDGFLADIAARRIRCPPASRAGSASRTPAPPTSPSRAWPSRAARGAWTSARRTARPT